MPKKAFSFFQYKMLARSLCFLSLASSSIQLEAKVNPKLDESVSYTMNFRNINIVEYIRFVSKISKINFIFNEQELAFPVTLVSDQPVSAKNLFSALAQVLEVNGFNLSDQDGSILITKSAGSSQLGPINHLEAPLITRIYKIENVNLVTLTQIVKSVVSKGALVESLLDTHQLIVTDTGPNLDKLGALIHDLDSSGSNLKILSYKVKNQSPSSLSDTLIKMMAPFMGTNPYLSVPQPLNNQILIVSTPYLLEQTKEALVAIDIPDAQIPIENGSANVYLYTPKFRKVSDIKAALMMMAETLQAEGPSTASLVGMIQSLKTPGGSTSILFVGNKATWEKLQELLSGIDNKDSVQTLFVYAIQASKPDELENLLKEMASRVEETGDPDHLAEAIDSMTYVQSTNSLVFSGSQAAVERLKTLLPSLDLGSSEDKDRNFVIVELKNVAGDTVISELKSLESTIPKGDSPNMIAAINSIKWLKNNNSLLLFGSKKTVTMLEALIMKLDVPSTASSVSSRGGFVVYTLKGQNGQAIVDQLRSMSDEVVATNDQAKANKEALKKVKYIPDTNSIMIFGNQESINFIEELITKIDSATPLKSGSSFAFYPLKSKNGEDVEDKLHSFAKTLPQKTAQDKAIVSALKSAKYVEDTNSILIQGNAEAIAFVESLAAKFDEGAKVSKNTTFVVYTLKGSSGETVVQQLREMALHITDRSPQSQEIKNCLETVKYLPDTNSVMITGSKEAINFAETIIEKIDTGPQPGTQASFFLYKLQSQPGNKVIKKLQSFAEKLPASTLTDRNVINAIKNLEWIQDNNAILISGNQQTIDRVSALIAQYDTTMVSKGDNKGDFLIYSPKYLSLDMLEESMQEYAVALKQSGLVDPNLIETINTAKSVPSANHLVFTGNADSISKIKSILILIDQENPQSGIQQVGQNTFYVHQLRSLTPDQFSQTLKGYEANLSKTHKLSPDVSKAISSMQYLKETNSFLFTGSKDALDQVAQIADKIDMGKTAVAGEMSYDIYNPKFQTGEELILQMCQFAEGVANSGIDDKMLFDTINNIKWIEKSNSMIITGTKENLAKVQDLLVKFDVPNSEKPQASPASMGFMVYKLQYHSGVEIQTSLNKLAPTFAANGPNPNPGLAASINSIQWIQATNSLVASGDPENLEKLKILITEIDAPLKQVFIEVLVIETDTINTQNFGLQWFGKGQIKNQLGFGTGNFAGLNPITNSTTAPNFSGPASGINLGTPPSGQSIPFYGNQGNGNTSGPTTPGFDLGVIGDVLFHKGKSFVSLGSLVNALQADSDSTIVMNPKIISQDSQNSKIFIGQNIPFVGSSLSNTSANTLTSQNLEYRDVGTSLSITPKLGDDNVITLEITYNASAVVNNTNGSQGGLNGIQTSQTNMTTRVHVPDQHFVVLSGMLTDKRSSLKSGIPCLGGLPIIGLAFSETDRLKNKSNILIFIRPSIVHNLDDLRELTEKQENKYRDSLDRKVDKEDFDSGINMVKEAGDE